MSIKLVIISNHLILGLPFSFCLKPSQHQGLFQWVGSSHQVAKVLELQLQQLQWIFRVDCVLTIIIDLQELSGFHSMLPAMKVRASGIGYLLRWLIRQNHEFSTCDPWASTVSLTWELVWNVQFQVPLRFTELEAHEWVGPRKSWLTSLAGDSGTWSGWRFPDWGPSLHSCHPSGHNLFSVQNIWTINLEWYLNLEERADKPGLKFWLHHLLLMWFWTYY